MNAAASQLRQLMHDLAPRRLESAESFQTGVGAIDRLVGETHLARRAVHELLSAEADGEAYTVAAAFARAATTSVACERKMVVWCDSRQSVYSPGLIARGLDAARLLILRPQRPEDAVWAVAECLRCKGVSVVIAELSRLSQIDARRLQLAAEQGGGVGIFMRPAGRASACYSAATRWLVEPAPGDSFTQRWNVQLLHGHGRCVGQSVILEVSRDDNSVHSTEQLADPAVPTTTPAALRSA